ncbi:YhzD family protein [Robertmurraya sp. P23]|uniref:YhzD family protein n=1 Tax=Robertmurraya sp. P23 TaxID=3436931 RepID=UPI003D99B602
MKVYKLTCFEATGEKIIDEAIEAKNDMAAKDKAEVLLKEKELNKKTYRLVSPDGNLILFKA